MALRSWSKTPWQSWAHFHIEDKCISFQTAINVHPPWITGTLFMQTMHIICTTICIRNQSENYALEINLLKSCIQFYFLYMYELCLLFCACVHMILIKQVFKTFIMFSANVLWCRKCLLFLKKITVLQYTQCVWMGNIECSTPYLFTQKAPQDACFGNRSSANVMKVCCSQL